MTIERDMHPQEFRSEWEAARTQAIHGADNKRNLRQLTGAVKEGIIDIFIAVKHTTSHKPTKI